MQMIQYTSLRGETKMVDPDGFGYRTREDLVYGAKLLNERADCTVKATAVGFDVAYEVAHATCKLVGRKPRQGIHYASKLLKLGKLLEKTVTEVDLYHIIMNVRKGQDRGCRISVSRISEYLDPKKRYVAVTASHALGIAYGVVIDWTKNRQHRVQRVWEIS